MDMSWIAVADEGQYAELSGIQRLVCGGEL